MTRLLAEEVTDEERDSWYGEWPEESELDFDDGVATPRELLDIVAKPPRGRMFH